MKIGVIGTGHVGLVACVTYAEMGHQVVGVDVDEERVDQLGRGIAPFFEPGLVELLQRHLAGGSLSFSTAIADAVRGAEVVFICVGTPSRATGEANLLAVERVAREVAVHSDQAAGGRLVLVQKSTVPAGTATRVRRALRMANRDAGARVSVASNPEFLREGQAIRDSLEPDRILVGADSVYAFEAMRRLYKSLIDNGTEYIETDVPTAELAKHASNAFLALKISYANALARLCERSGADVTRVADIMGSDPRIGRAFLDAGMGYGGFCFPKDLQAFEHLSDSLGYDFPLLREVARLNNEALVATLTKIKEGVWNLEDKRVALLGLSFKPGTDDVRFAPALELAQRLLDEGATVVGYDPQAMTNAKQEVPGLELAADPYEAASGAHCLVLCTQWPEFRDLDLHHLRRVMTDPLVVDGRNLFDARQMAAAGFLYFSVGRPPGGLEIDLRDVGETQQADASS
ncbi:MAG TPA: UDP-glucose/GDP-mannose dehydrogenase family protein [Actinomycetota bacterium]